MQTRRKRSRDNAMPDLTPMIDVTFQLLIFFILVTRFKVDERDFRTELPRDEGSVRQESRVPKEQLTIYCNWDEAQGANSYVIGIDARGRKPVADSFARLEDLVIFAHDSNDTILLKKQRYKRMFETLVASAEKYISTSGANIEKIEIAFAKNSAEGAVSGTAPWMFVSTAIDAAAGINERRVEAGEPKLDLTFKFTDALGVYR
ncbi:MAG: biopolymer transporter ExbD [Planctomycetes bacterium]|nr:biopolymer transporter ExbD [Planctomycetota bacterium]